MIYDLSLRSVGIAVGLLLIALHTIPLAHGEAVKRWLVRLPRSHRIGVALIGADLVWTFWLARVMDWGEFYYLRSPILVLLPAFAVLTVIFVDEYLAVRGLGILGLLAAAPLLDSAFLQPQFSRLLLVILAYVWAILGMFWIASPHLLRDQIHWLLRSAARFQAAVFAGIIYGAAVLLCALVWY